MSKIIEAETLSEDKTKLMIKLNNDTIIEGYSMGIEPAFDDEGNELEYDVLVFKVDEFNNPLYLKNEDIIEVAKAS